MAVLLLLAATAIAAGCVSERDFPEGEGQQFALKPSQNHLEFLLSQSADESDMARFQQIQLRSNDGSLVNWAVISDTPWISLSPPGGQTTNEIDEIGVGVDPGSLAPGVYTASIRIVENTDENTPSQEQRVTVTVRVCATTCVSIDPANSTHTVSMLLFGGQTEFLNSGTGIWDSIVTSSCQDPAVPPGGANQEQLAEFRNLGINSLRYPSGVPSDFFHWSEAIGPTYYRLPQINPWISEYGNLQKECPVFGPDEFAQFAQLLDASMMITSNAATGTAQDAADWLSYYETNGVETDFWEIGNEIYIDGPEYLFDAAYMTPTEYAAAFNAQARALRQIRPDISVGAVMSPMGQDWNRETMAAITEPFDFISLHSWQPQIDTCIQPDDTIVFESLLASPLLMEVQLGFIRDIARDLGITANKSPSFIITEWGPWFLPCAAGGTPNNDARARSLGAALFSGLIYNTMLRDPSVFSSFHSTLASFQAQAPLNFVWDNGWVPIRSAYYYVHELYAASIDGKIIPTKMHGSPEFATKLFDDDIEDTELPVLDSVAVLSKDNSRLYVYLVNRSLYNDIDTQIFNGGLPYPVDSIVSDTLTAGSFSDLNTAAQPDAVALIKTVHAPAGELRLTIPKHSLMRITVTLAVN